MHFIIIWTLIALKIIADQTKLFKKGTKQLNKLTWGISVIDQLSTFHRALHTLIPALWTLNEQFHIWYLFFQMLTQTVPHVLDSEFPTTPDKRSRQALFQLHMDSRGVASEITENVVEKYTNHSWMIKEVSCGTLKTQRSTGEGKRNGLYSQTLS